MGAKNNDAQEKPDFSLETFQGVWPVAGVDEAGRGPWAGPVVAGAVILFPSKIPDSLLYQINDSKKVSEKKRSAIVDALKICTQGFIGAIGIASVEEIDQQNILQATFLAMHRAVTALKERPAAILVDGNMTPHWDIPSTCVVKGDQRSLSIAAASLLAKVERDIIMKRLAHLHPEYGWESNAGYGTRKHAYALERYGVTPHHRKSFAPIARTLMQKQP